MKCEHKTCSLRFNCQLQLSDSEFKLIIENPNIIQCIYQKPLEKTA